MRQHIVVNSKRICGDNTQYDYVSDAVFRTWDKCPTCFNEVVKMRPLHPSGPLRPHLDKPKPVPQVKRGLFLREALE